MTFPLCSPELPNNAVSDPTNDDSSNLPATSSSTYFKEQLFKFSTPAKDTKTYLFTSAETPLVTLACKTFL